MTRRLLLQGLLLSLTLWSRAAAAACWLSGRLQTAGEPLAADPIPSSPETTGLSAAELESLVGFGEVLVAGRTLLPTERDQLVEHITGSTQGSPDALTLYRTTTALLDRLAGGPFARLEITERIELIGRHRLDVRGILADADIAHLGPDAKAVRERAVPDLINGYWRSPAGWAAVGYGTFPGRCGDLTRYTRPNA